jgi:taurine dioxygenase
MGDTLTTSVTPLSPALGAEISGVDLGDDLDRHTIVQITDALHEHIVVVFRDQDLSEEQQLRFTSRFGEVGTRKRATGLHSDGRFMLVTNVTVDGEPLGSYGDGEMWFHSDGAYADIPYKYSFLYGIELPSRGGNTRFANLYSAYDALPQALKEKLAGRKMLQMGGSRRREKGDPTADLSKIPHAWHPLFTTHPATKKKSLYFSRMHSVLIEGLDPEDSEATIDELVGYSERPEFIYEHVWRPGDLVVWDNRCSNHARTHFPDEESRLLRRCTVVGEAPRE